MEHRKIILFGKSAFCITLPQAWAKKNKLRKGDTLGVEETSRNTLEVIPTESEPKEMECFELDISEKSTDETLALLLSIYINGYTQIILRGSNAGKVPTIRKYVQQLIAAEIMEVTANKIVINIFWDVRSINLASIIARTDNILRAIFLETITMVESKTDIKDLMEKGYEVQRQVMLARRAITCALSNSTVAQKLEHSPVGLYYISSMIYSYGKIGEYMIAIAHIIEISKQNSALNPKIKEELKPLLIRTLKYFERVQDAYNKQAKGKKFILIGPRGLDDSNGEKTFRAKIPVISEYIKMIVTKIKEIELTLINMETAHK